MEWHPANACRPQPLTLAILAVLVAAAVVARTMITAPVSLPARDAGEFVQLPARWLQGDVPYRDFLMFYPPGYLILPALISRLAGGQLLTIAIISGVLEALTIGVCIWFWTPGRRVLPGAYLAVVLLFVGFGETLMVWASILLLTLVFARAPRAASLWTAAGVGLLAGVAGSVRMEQTPGLLGASVLALAIWGHRSLGWRRVAIWSAVCVAAALVPWALSAFWMAAHGALPQMVYHLTTLVRRHVAAMWCPPFWLVLLPPDPLRVAIKMAGFCSPVVLLLWGIAAQIAWSRRNPSADRQQQTLFTFWLILGGLLATRISIRGDLIHVFGASIALLVSGAWSLDASWRMGARWRIAAVVLAAFVMATPLAMLAEGYIGLPALVRAARGYVPVDSPVARGMALPPQDAEGVNAVLRFLREHARPGEPIFVTDFGAPVYYLLSGHPNGTRYDSLLPGMVSSQEEIELVAKLRSGPVRYIIGQEDWVVDRMPQRAFSRSLPLLHAYQVNECHPVMQVGSQTVWERNSQPTTK